MEYVVAGAMHVVCALLSLAQLWWELRSLHECAPVGGHPYSPNVAAGTGCKRKLGQICLGMHDTQKKMKLDQDLSFDLGAGFAEGWIHDLTSDGDIEPNPGPSMGDYLVWATG
eukprot:5047120-Amphidinium_carterae.1